MEEENVKDNPIQNMSSRMVGHPNESKIFMNGLETRALIDTVSMVTCMSKNCISFFNVNLNFMIFRILNLRYIVQMVNPCHFLAM